jgi:hypothetical protein
MLVDATKQHQRQDSALTLLVSGVLTDDADHALAAHHLAVPADFLNGCPYFHF